MRHVDGFGIEGDLARAQARHGHEGVATVADLDEQILALLSRHGMSLC
jgi:hypothetical protein